MTGINHRRKNPIHSAASSRATKVEQVRRSYRTLQKQAFPSRIASNSGGIKQVMGRVVAVGRNAVLQGFGTTEAHQGGSVATGSRAGRRIDQAATRSGSAMGEGRQSVEDTALRVTGRLTVDELLEEDNLAGLPDRFRMNSGYGRALHQVSTGYYARDEGDDLTEGMTEYHPEYAMEGIEGRSESSEDPLMIYPTRGRSVDVASMAHEVELLHRSRRASTPVTEVEYSPKQFPRLFPEADLASDQPHLHNNEQVDPARFPISSESGWEEPGTLSSHDGGFAEDFDEERDGFSDAGEDEQMLDCSDDAEEEASARETKGSNLVEEQLGVADSTSAVFYTAPDASEQERTARMAYGEVSRFFSSSTGFAGGATDDVGPAWKGVPDGTAVGSTLVTSYRHTALHSVLDFDFDDQATGREAEITWALMRRHSQDRDSAIGAGVQGRSSFVANDAITGSCGIHPYPAYSEIGERHAAIPGSGNAGLGSPQDSARGPVPGEFDALQSTKELDRMFDEELGPPVSQSMGGTKFAKQARIIPYSDSSPSPVTNSRESDLQICTSAERHSAIHRHANNRPAFNPTETTMAHPSVGSRSREPFVGSTSVYHRERYYAPAEQNNSENGDSGIESFGSEPYVGKDIEAEAFEEVSDKTRVNTSDEETEKEEVDEEEAEFQHRLFSNPYQNDNSMTMWRIAQWNQSKTDETDPENYRRYDPDNEHEAHQHERYDYPRRRSERLANSSLLRMQRLWSREWKHQEGPVGRDARGESPRARRLLGNALSEEWEVIEEAPPSDLELLGEDGLPYVFEAVLSEPAAVASDEPQLPVGTPSIREGGSGGLLFDQAANPFLEGGDTTSEQHPGASVSMPLPSFDQVIVVYNYPGATTTTGIDEPGQEAKQPAAQMKLDEETVLQEVRVYFGNLTKMLVEDVEG